MKNKNISQDKTLIFVGYNLGIEVEEYEKYKKR